MGLQDTVTQAVRGFAQKVQRSLIGYSICALCGLAVLILATGAAVMALIPLVGAVYAQLIVASVFLVVIVITMFWLQRPARDAARPLPVGAATEAATPASGAIRADCHDHRSGDARLLAVAQALTPFRCPQ